jgi:hypothetical protein
MRPPGTRGHQLRNGGKQSTNELKTMSEDESNLEMTERQRTVLENEGDLEISDEVQELVADPLEKHNQGDSDTND